METVLIIVLVMLGIAIAGVSVAGALYNPVRTASDVYYVCQNTDLAEDACEGGQEYRARRNALKWRVPLTLISLAGLALWKLPIGDISTGNSAVDWEMVGLIVFLLPGLTAMGMQYIRKYAGSRLTGRTAISKNPKLGKQGVSQPAETLLEPARNGTKMIICSACAGSGRVRFQFAKREAICQPCGGRGEVRYSPSSGVSKVSQAAEPEEMETTLPTNKREMVTCPPCGGSGLVDCSSCEGKGREICPECKGRRYKVLDDYTLGKVGNRNAGAVTFRKEQCIRCQARGYLDTLCSECGGRAKVRCSLCSGGGEVSEEAAKRYIRRQIVTGVVILVIVVGVIWAIYSCFNGGGC